MVSRRDRLNVLGYTYTLVIVYAYITDVNTTACTDQTGMDNFFHVKRMCTSGTLRQSAVVIDTWNTGGLDIYSCTCTITLTGSASPTDTTTVVVQEYPRIAPLKNCGSILRISSTKSSLVNAYGCAPVSNYPTNNFGTSDTLTLKQSREDVSTAWTSGHCLYITSQGSTYFGLIVTCNEAQGKTNQSTTTTITTTTPTNAEYVPTTTVQPFTTTTATYTKETTANSRETTTTTNINSGSTTLGREKCVQECHPQQGYPLSAVVAPLVVTTLLITVSMVAHVILYRRRLTLVKQPVYTEAVMTSPNPVQYDSLDLSRVEPPNLYADTSTGQMYANTAMES